MTKRECLIVSAYTGFLMCEFSKLHEYVEKLMGRPVYSHEFGNKEFLEQLGELTKEEFLKLANDAVD